MKTTSVLVSVLAMAVAAASAAPTVENRNNGGSCKTDQNQVCCSGLLDCLVQVVGSTCSSQAYCCNTDAPVGTLVNVALLNCVELL